MRATVLLLALALAGCGDSLIFPCSESTQCVRSGKSGGLCARAASATSRYCAFADSGCPSGKRFDATAGEGLAGRCVGSAGFDLSLTGGDDMMPSTDDLAMEPEADMAGLPELIWNTVDAKIASDLWCVGGYNDLHVWVGGPDGIWFSGDDGRTWDKQTLPGNAGSITSIWAFPRRIWAVNHDSQILYSSDEGVNWQLQQVPVNVQGRFFTVWGTSPINLFISGDGGLMLHTDNGTTWREQTITGSIGYLNTVWGSSKDEVFASGGSGVQGVRTPMAHTTNAGMVWSVGMLPSDLIIFRLWGSSGSDVYAIGEQQVIYHSVGGGFSELRKATGSENDAFYGIWGTGPDNVLIGGTSGLLIRSTDGGKMWVEQASHTSADLAAVWGSRKNNVYVVGTGGTILHGTP